MITVTCTIITLGVLSQITNLHGAVPADCTPGTAAMMDAFSHTEFVGVWYSRHWKHVAVDESMFVFTDYKWTIGTENDTALETETELWDNITGTPSCRKNEFYITLNADEAEPLTFTLNDKNLELWVLEADFASYAVIRECILDDEGNCPDTGVEYAIWTRSATSAIAAETVTSIRAILEPLCIEFDDFEDIPHNGACPIDTPETSTESTMAPPASNSFRTHPWCITLLFMFMIFNVLVCKSMQLD